MIQTLQLPGTDPELYRLVAPLVMNPVVLRQNYNFPFRTSEKFVWFVATDGDEILGFLPVEQKRFEYVINNYYVRGKDPDVLQQLVEATLEALGDKTDVAVISFMHDVELFKTHGFESEKTWTRYVRMVKKQK